MRDRIWEAPRLERTLERLGPSFVGGAGVTRFWAAVPERGHAAQHESPSQPAGVRPWLYCDGRDPGARRESASMSSNRPPRPRGKLPPSDVWSQDVYRQLPNSG